MQAAFLRQESQFDDYAAMAHEIMRLETFLKVIDLNLTVTCSHSDVARTVVNGKFKTETPDQPEGLEVLWLPNRLSLAILNSLGQVTNAVGFDHVALCGRDKDLLIR